jgi:type VI secretion system protein ImpC
MATRFTGGNIDVDLVGEEVKKRPTADPETPFRVAILGDFTGRGSRDVAKPGGLLSNRRVYQIDRDNFSEVISELKVELHIPILGKDSPPVILHVNDLESFHPDRLFENLEIFNALKTTRQSLKDPATFAAVAQRLEASAAPPKRSGSVRADDSTSNLLDQIVNAAEGKSATGQFRPPSDLRDFVTQIVRPHVVAKTDPMQGELVAKVDAAIGELMRKILHHPDFQALEAAWRGLYFLVSRLETDQNLKIFLVDISKAELRSDLSEAKEITRTEIYRLLVNQKTVETGGEPWAVLGGNFVFDRTDDDAAILIGLAKLANAAGAPFIAAAHPHLLGCQSLTDTPDPDDWTLPPNPKTDETWAALRKTPDAASIGLALPGFLLRLPYGKETEPTELIDFEEMPNVPPHDEYLWGNPAFACICLLAQSFSEYGWDFQPGVIQEISGLPIHLYKDQGESRMKPCAEVLLTQRAAEKILDRGPMPLLSFIHQDIVRLARFQSFADPPSPLFGRWR